jgi:hypothetical protein
MDGGLMWLWICIAVLIVGVVMSYSSVPALVTGLQNQAPFEYNALGCPDTSELFSRFPNGLQYRFAWFVLRGQAYAVTRGSARASAVAAWLGYVLTLAGIVGFLMIGRPAP